MVSHVNSLLRYTKNYESAPHHVFSVRSNHFSDIGSWFLESWCFVRGIYHHLLFLCSCTALFHSGSNKFFWCDCTRNGVVNQWLLEGWWLLVCILHGCLLFHSNSLFLLYSCTIQDNGCWFFLPYLLTNNFWVFSLYTEYFSSYSSFNEAPIFSFNVPWHISRPGVPPLVVLFFF